MDRDKQQLSIEAARLYYLSDYSQQEIASSLTCRGQRCLVCFSMRRKKGTSKLQ